MFSPWIWVTGSLCQASTVTFDKVLSSMKLFRNSNLRSAAGIFNIQDVSTQTNHFFNSRGLASSVVDASHLANTPGEHGFSKRRPKAANWRFLSAFGKSDGFCKFWIASFWSSVSTLIRFPWVPIWPRLMEERDLAIALLLGLGFARQLHHSIHT